MSILSRRIIRARCFATASYFVWLARDEELERDVALKFLPDLIIHDRAVLSDLKRETRRSLELTHKNIVRIYDFVQDEASGCISQHQTRQVKLGSLGNESGLRPVEARDPAGVAVGVVLYRGNVLSSAGAN